jgi:hypothetical protein
MNIYFFALLIGLKSNLRHYILCLKIWGATETQAMTQGSPLILNTFNNLEAPILSHLAPLFSKIYTIGPLNALLRSCIGEDALRVVSSSSNLWEADRSCMTWLDS